jgi:hypothetical protein
MNVGDLRTWAKPDRLERQFRRHAVAFWIANGLLIAVNWVLGGGWWSFWVTFVWAVVFALHYFVFKSLTIDPGWVQERAEDIGMRSSDFGHIYDIKDRMRERDPSVRPSDERDADA